MGAAVVMASALALAPPALGWSDRGHVLIVEEAVHRLPDPLGALLAEEGAMRRLRAAAVMPDDYRTPGSSRYRLDERPRHFFDIDAITSEPFPFTNFPRDRKAAEKEFGPEVFKKSGVAPWAADEALAALVRALAEGKTDDIFKSAGDLAHYTADLHMPFHVTKNYDGKLSGNDGIHAALEIGLVHRYLEFYAAEVRKDRYDLPYAADTVDRLFAWLVEANGRVAPILDADAAARTKTAYNPSQHTEDLDDLTSERAQPYYAALKGELESRRSPEAAALREACGHVAELFYTAWVRAGKPLALAPAPRAPAESPTPPYWLIAVALGSLVLLLWPRRKPAS